MAVKLVRDQIRKLLNAAIDKYVNDTGFSITQNTSTNNYIGFAEKLSETSRKLPELDPEKFRSSAGEGNLETRFLITPAQIRDALLWKEGLKEYFYETLHWYLYNKPSREVQPDPGSATDQPTVEALTEQITDYKSQIADYGNRVTDYQNQIANYENQTADYADQITVHQNRITAYEYQATVSRKRTVALLVVAGTLLAGSVFFVYRWLAVKQHFETLRKDIGITYKPTQSEIDQLTGVWIAYTGSPQARISNTNADRWRIVVKDVVIIKYKDGYFSFDRHGPLLSHPGYMQFEGPGQVAIHSHLTDLGVSKPKLSLLELEKGKDTFNVMSVSWNWDRKNVIIGIREVYIKIGNGGKIELASQYDHIGFKGRIYHWIKENGKVDTVEAKNEFLDTLQKPLRPLLNEDSYIFLTPDSNSRPKKPVLK